VYVLIQYTYCGDIVLVAQGRLICSKGMETEIGSSKVETGSCRWMVGICRSLMVGTCNSTVESMKVGICRNLKVGTDNSMKGICRSL